jgi:hypothetical protein
LKTVLEVSTWVLFHLLLAKVVLAAADSVLICGRRYTLPELLTPYGSISQLSKGKTA